MQKDYQISDEELGQHFEDHILSCPICGGDEESEAGWCDDGRGMRDEIHHRHELRKAAEPKCSHCGQSRGHVRLLREALSAAHLAGNYLEKQRDERTAERDSLREALRAAPMPFAESTYSDEEWDTAYDEWWHKYASEEALDNG